MGMQLYTQGLELSEVKWVTQGHAGKDFEPHLYAFKVHVLNTMLVWNFKNLLKFQESLEMPVKTIVWTRESHKRGQVTHRELGLSCKMSGAP